MNAFSQRHYQEIAETLARCEASDAVVAEFVCAFRNDSPSFKSRLFVEAVRTAQRSYVARAAMADHASVAAWRKG